MSSHARILVTGGTGFVGSYLLDALSRAYAGSERRILLRPGEAGGGASWKPVVADLLDEIGIERAIREVRPDLVIHLAAQASAAQSLAAAETTWRVNFQGSLNLAGALARHAPTAVVLFVSSGEVYGLRLRDGAATEETAPSPLSAYARSKLAAEGMFADILPQTSRLIIARPFNHIGPGQDTRFALPSFAAQIAAIEQRRLAPRVDVGDLSVERDFLDVRDVVDAYLRLVEAAPGMAPRNVFNIASGQPRSLASLLEALRSLATADFDIVVDPARLRPSDVAKVVGDASKLRELTGWRPHRAIDETLVALLDYWRAIEAETAAPSSAKDASR